MRPRNHWGRSIVGLTPAIATIGIAVFIESIAAQDVAHRATALLRERCILCHGPSQHESGLRLDNADDARRGGDGGPVITAGHAEDSELIRRVASQDADERMPPKGSPLRPEQVGLLSDWIASGAVWPAERRTSTAWSDDRMSHWAWQPLAAGSPPPAEDDASWIRSEIDNFILARLRGAGLTPAPEADRQTLIRRVTFDLIGLPPTPEEVRSFVEDPDSQAYEKLVDRLLASPRFGERWARHWLDVVHYADTHGYDKDQPRPNAWPYRDYVIRAFNEDKAYATFVSEQIAGDVLTPNSRDGAEAIGFLAAGPWDLIGHAEVPESKIDGKIARHLDRDDMVANTIGTFCSVTVHCAQCHDHKFDPITQQDYYSLQAVFAALDRADRRYYEDPSQGIRAEELRESKRELEVTLAQLKTLLSAKPAPEDESKIESVSTLAQAKLAAIDASLAMFPQPSTVYCATVYRGDGAFCGTGPNGEPRPIRVLERGNVLKPGALAEPGALAMLTMLPGRFGLANSLREGDRRAALADWLTDSANPLTWRSIVNRVWQQHFGLGIVDTANDFGRMGGRPSHPELLDWLAADFRDHGGSLKRLHRQIVLSATYRQRSDPSHDERFERASALDMENRWLWRQNRRKLDAESIHDAVLACSGRLDLAMGGPGYQDFVIEHPEHSPHYEYDKADPRDARCYRRAIYRFIVRSQTQPFLSTLDCADPSQRVAKRNEGDSPLQALTLLNNSFMMTQAEFFSERLRSEAGDDRARQVNLAVQWTWGRLPNSEERRELIEFADQFGWPSLCRALFNSNEFVFVD